LTPQGVAPPARSAAGASTDHWTFPPGVGLACAPFVDASKLGHGRALANMAAITGGFLIVAVALVGVTRLSAREEVRT
jgi:hypothetical protein